MQEIESSYYPPLFINYDARCTWLAGHEGADWQKVRTYVCRSRELWQDDSGLWSNLSCSFGSDDPLCCGGSRHTHHRSAGCLPATVHDWSGSCWRDRCICTLLLGNNKHKQILKGFFRSQLRKELFFHPLLYKKNIFNIFKSHKCQGQTFILTNIQQSLHFSNRYNDTDDLWHQTYFWCESTCCVPSAVIDSGVPSLTLTLVRRPGETVGRLPGSVVVERRTALTVVTSCVVSAHTLSMDLWGSQRRRTITTEESKSISLMSLSVVSSHLILHVSYFSRNCSIILIVNYLFNLL